jgi:gas vesicle protein
VQAERKLARTYKTQLDNLKEQLTGSQEANTEMKARIKQVQKDTKTKALPDFEAEKKCFSKSLQKKMIN